MKCSTPRLRCRIGAIDAQRLMASERHSFAWVRRHRPQLPRIRELFLSRPSPIMNNSGDADQWRFALARMGVAIEDLPVFPNQSPQSFERDLRQVADKMRRYEQENATRGRNYYRQLDLPSGELQSAIWPRIGDVEVHCRSGGTVWPAQIRLLMARLCAKRTMQTVTTVAGDAGWVFGWVGGCICGGIF